MDEPISLAEALPLVRRILRERPARRVAPPRVVFGLHHWTNQGVRAADGTQVRLGLVPAANGWTRPPGAKGPTPRKFTTERLVREFLARLTD